MAAPSVPSVVRVEFPSSHFSYLMLLVEGADAGRRLDLKHALEFAELAGKLGDAMERNNQYEPFIETMRAGLRTLV